MKIHPLIFLIFMVSLQNAIGQNYLEIIVKNDDKTPQDTVSYSSWQQFQQSNTNIRLSAEIIRIRDQDGNIKLPELGKQTVRSLSSHPQKNNILYAGLKGRNAGDSFVCMSYDYGQTWTYLNKHLPLSPTSRDVQTIEVSPFNSNLIYAGTWKEGLFKSTDGGNTFSKDTSFVSNDVRKVLFDVNNENRIFIASATHGLILSEDTGKTWKSVAKEKLLAEEAVWGLFQHPVDNKAVFALTYNKGLLKTTNGGQSWQQVLAITNKICFDIAVSKRNPNHLWMVCGNRKDRVSSLYSSKDRGQTWSKDNDLDDLLLQVAVVSHSDGDKTLVGGLKGIYEYKDNMLTPSNLPTPFPAISEILEVEDRIVVATWGNGVLSIVNGLE